MDRTGDGERSYTFSATLYLYGSAVLTIGERMRRHIGNLRSVAVAGVGQMMHHEDSATVAKHIIEFEDECTGRPA